MASNTSTWPPSNGLFTPIVSRENAVLTLNYSIKINAAASRVFEILRNTPEWPQWNSWVPKVTIHSQPPSAPDSHILNTNTSLTFHVIMNAAKPQSETPTQLRISDISTPEQPSHYLSDEQLTDASYTSDLSKVYRISWKGEGGFVSKGLKTERFHEVIVLGENECEVRTWEVMGGMLAHTVKWLYQKTLEEKFKLWCEDLKKFAESQASSGAAGPTDGGKE